MRAILLVAILLAGCASAPAPSPRAAAPSAAFSAPIAIGPEPGWEPSIARAPDGSIFLSVPGAANDRASHLHVTHDRGATWTEVALSPLARSLGDTTISIGPDGAILLADLTPAGNTVSVSHDAGRSWSATPVAGPAPGDDRQWVLADSKGRMHLISGDLTTGDIAYATSSTDGGATWSAPVVVWQSRDWGAGTDGPLVENARAGTILFAHTCHDHTAVCVSSSADGGATWKTSLVADRGQSTFHDLTIAAVDPAGAIHVVWSDAVGGALRIRMSSSTDGSHWSEPRAIDPTGGAQVFPWIAADPRGQLAIAWYATSVNADPNDVTAMKDAQWSVRFARLDGDRASIVNATGIMHTGSISTIGITPTTDQAPDRSLGDFFSFTFDASGRAVIAYLDSTAPGGAHIAVVRELAAP